MNVAQLVQTAMGAVPSDLKAAVVFTSTSPGTYDEATSTFSVSSTTSVAGTASRDKGDPKRYQRLNLTPSEAPTLIFVPNTIGEEPELGMTVYFGGVTYVVKDVEPIAPAGVSFASSVVVGL